MEWTDDGIVLSARRHGEGGAVVTLLTRRHGRHAGLVRGGGGRKARGVYQPGNRVSAEWRARLAEHLGTLRCELVHSHAGDALADAAALSGLAAACATAEAALPERAAHPAVYEGLLALLGALGEPGWPGLYAKWELGLLAELGFGLDLSRCAATGRNDDLAYVSPRTGRAVSLSAGADWRNVLLPLPRYLLEEGAAGDAGQAAEALALTGFFLERHVFAPHSRGQPAARARFVDRVAQMPTISRG